MGQGAAVQGQATQCRATAMPSIPKSHKRNIFKYRTGEIWNKNIAFKRHISYMPGQPIARDTRCPLCKGDASHSHISGSYIHPDMNKQYIARHHEQPWEHSAKPSIKGSVVVTVWLQMLGRLKDPKTWACTVREFQPLYFQTDVYKQGAWILRWRGFLQGGSSKHTEQDEASHDDSGNETAEQQHYLRHDDNSGSRLIPLTPVMRNANPRSLKIVQPHLEEGYCLDTR